MYPLRFFLYFIISFVTAPLLLHSIEKTPIKTDAQKTSLQSKVIDALHKLKSKGEAQIKKIKHYVRPYEKDFKKINKWVNILFGATFYPIVKSVIIAHECGHAAVAQLAGYELQEFYISPNPDGAGYVITTTPQHTHAKLYELCAGPLAGFTASLAWLKLLNIIKDCAGSRNLSLFKAIREPLFSANTSLLAFGVTFSLALGQLYGNLVPQDIECEDQYGDAYEGQTVPNDGKQIETILNRIAPRIGKYYSSFTYALCGVFLCYMMHAEYTILATKDSGLMIGY